MLFPTDPLRPRRPDEHLGPEVAAARELGHAIGLVDLEALAADDVDAAVAAVRGPATEAVYRGWMLDAGRYATLATALAARGVTLRTGPAAYRRAHELPGWYDDLRELTPDTTWTDGDDRAAFDRARRVLLERHPEGTAAVLRDWVKSAKHDWDTAAFVPDLADADAAWAVASRLREIRDDAFTGGFVLRRFETFVGPEARTWWRDGRCVLVGPHPDTPDVVAEGLDPAALALLVAPAVRATGLRFVTVDLVRDDGGRWRVVELGDGQVSDRPSSVDPAAFVAAVAPV